MSRHQAKQLHAFLRAFAQSGDHQFHFGTHASVELKADTEAAEIAFGYGYRLVPHPATRGTELKRDREQVAATDFTIAAPLTDKEQPRSGTWTTVRYTREAMKPVILLARGKS
jgi:cation transport regulator ChaC